MGVRARAILECQQAARADHLREFRWTPSFGDRTWTLLLVPVYATYYLDDELVPRQILINGQTGQLAGARRGSLIRAKGRSLTIGIIAIVLLALSLAVGLGGLLFPPLIVAAVIGGMIALVVGAGAFVPLVRTTQFNRREAARSSEI
jgi:hypothetical protein